ncbi:hypothetical protein ELI02_15600 [Rhizobium leguminosarum]|nr:hypothetical protein ELI01_17160 [Rhizobium leguminosarum]TAX61345.1 hypothetical protein ELI02_15600 [Rhizobium leguminosarum]TAY02778.1 hypothetical protein ELH95_17560 [Rhizobium leguminosarum]
MSHHGFGASRLCWAACAHGAIERVMMREPMPSDLKDMRFPVSTGGRKFPRSAIYWRRPGIGISETSFRHPAMNRLKSAKH